MNDNDKKVDTQTTEKVEGTNANAADEAGKTGADEQNTAANNTKETNSNTNKDDITVDEERIANAFGNKTEKNKSEVEKGKKANTVAQTNADGSITFKNQEELDGFIDRMYKKGVDQGAKQGNEQNAGTKAQKEKEQNAVDNKEENTTNQETEGKTENTQIDTEGLIAKIALAMIDADINAKKAKKAARLVDVNKVITDGSIDEAKLKAEIDEIIAEWPELKAETTIDIANKGFAFGASQGNDNSNSDDAEISKIFGNA